MAKLVNWHEFTRNLQRKKILLFSAMDICRLFGASSTTVNLLLHRYQKKGLITRVKRGLYAFPDALPPEMYIANRIYDPSYVSLEFALSYHRIIPETVYALTSVTPKSTRHFETLGKIYSYRSIQKSAFTGYRTAQQNGVSFLVAEPEKAFVDANYFRVLDALPPIARCNLQKLDPKKTLRYAKLFHNAKLEALVKGTWS